MKDIVQDKFGNAIYLTDERWQHIIKRHPVLKNLKNEVLKTIRMQLLYDEEGDILDVIFKDDKRTVAEAGYELRQGMVLHVTANMLPVHLTIVSFRPLSRLPVVHFDHLKKQPSKIRQQLLQLIASPPVSAFLRVDPATYYGQVIAHPVLEASAKAA
jgi:hypothetical protein